MGVFLDIQAAFDSIKPEHIKNALLKHGCHPDMVDWYYELITHGNLVTTYENFVLEVTTNMGFPQGGYVVQILDHSLQRSSQNTKLKWCKRRAVFFGKGALFRGKGGPLVLE